MVEICSALYSQKVLCLFVLCIVVVIMCWTFSLLCNYWLLFNFDILYFSTDGCINKSLTYLLTLKLCDIRSWVMRCCWVPTAGMVGLAWLHAVFACCRLCARTRRANRHLRDQKWSQTKRFWTEWKMEGKIYEKPRESWSPVRRGCRSDHNLYVHVAYTTKIGRINLDVQSVMHWWCGLENQWWAFLTGRPTGIAVRPFYCYFKSSE